MLITLPDGRRLGYEEYGDPQGRPLLLFHGQPGNRLFRHPSEALTAMLGVRLITIDRPGYGLSDFQPGRKLLDWPGDVAALADALEIDRFALLGFSAGAPYALACACLIPECLTRVGLVNPAPPMHLPEIHRRASGSLRTNYLLAHYAPPLLKASFRLFWWFSRQDPEAFIKMALEQSPPADRRVLLRPEVNALLEEVWRENLRFAPRGYVQDVQILMGDWGFALAEVQKEVHLWQGETDENTPLEWARYIAKQLPHCKTTYYPEEGHFALFSHWEEILIELA
ncbi:MAG: alpha/beta hydrolase [Anaerolineales bacterium]|nr:alpha/beta hydrolase [Anaerolineales bacterium]